MNGKHLDASSHLLASTPAWRLAACAVILLLPALDVIWSIVHLAPGVPDFVVASSQARSLLESGLWPGSSYFPVGYPALLALSGWLGNMLLGNLLLSWIGLSLALWSLYRLLRMWGAAPAMAVMALATVYLLPETRVVSTEAHVDNPFNGLVMWFFAAVICVWGLAKREQMPRWALWGLLLPSIALPLLRNHALIVVVPILLVLIIARGWTIRPVLVCLLLFSFSYLFNVAGYTRCYGTYPPSVWQTYIRVGLELDRKLAVPAAQQGQGPEAVYKAASESIGMQFPELARRARENSLLADYRPAELFSHSLRQYWYFLRRPPLLLGLAACLTMLLLRRRLSPGRAPAALWIVLYSAGLSLTYYNLRKGYPQVLIGAALAFTLAAQLSQQPRLRLALPAAVAALLLAYTALHFPADFYARHVFLARASTVVEDITEQAGWEPAEVVVSGFTVIPLHDNPWCKPYARLDHRYQTDPAIPIQLSPDCYYFGSEAMAQRRAPLPAALVTEQHSSSVAVKRVLDPGGWQLVHDADGLRIYTPFH